MIKIGILSFTKNICESIIEFIENHHDCIITGISIYNKITMVDDDHKYITNIHDIIACSDLLIMDSAGSEQMPVVKEIIRNSKHLFLINSKKFLQHDTGEMLKLSCEAGTNLVFSQPNRINPQIRRFLDHLHMISFVNITENGFHEDDSLLYNKLIEKVDLLLMLVKSNIYRVSTCSSSDEFINIRLEFNNGVNANITINQLADSENSWVEILSPGENIKIDLINNKVFKINKNKKSMIRYETAKEACFIKNKSSIKELEMIIEAIVNGQEMEYNISEYHFANILTEEILKKISYVLV